MCNFISLLQLRIWKKNVPSKCHFMSAVTVTTTSWQCHLEVRADHIIEVSKFASATWDNAGLLMVCFVLNHHGIRVHYAPVILAISCFVDGSWTNISGFCVDHKCFIIRKRVWMFEYCFCPDHNRLKIESCLGLICEPHTIICFNFHVKRTCSGYHCFMTWRKQWQMIHTFDVIDDYRIKYTHSHNNHKIMGKLNTRLPYIVWKMYEDAIV